MNKNKFKQNKEEDGWKLLEDVPFNESDLKDLELVEFLKDGEDKIKGEEMRKRAKELNANLGQSHAEYLMEHFELLPDKAKNYRLIFSGTVWQVGGGYRSIPYLSWSGGRGDLVFDWFELDWNSY